MRTLAIALLVLSVNARAANEGGHGGGSIVCGNTDGSILSAELLDLWENREATDGRTFTVSADSEAEQLEAALTKFAEVAPWEVERMRRVLADLRTSPVAEGRMLLPPSDTGLRTLRRMRNCSLQGVAEFDDSTGILTVDPEILAAFDDTNRAALKFHEALYKVWRGTEVNASDSGVVRRITRWVFADQRLGFEAPDADRASALYECTAGDRFRFLVVRKARGPVEMHFLVFGSRAMIGKMVARVEYDQGLAAPARRIWGSVPEDPAEGMIAVTNLQTRLLDGVRQMTVPATRGQEDPSYYPPLPFHYTVPLWVRSRYEPGAAVLIWGGDFFTSERNREIGVNLRFSIHSLSSFGPTNRWNGTVQCRRP